MQIKKIAAIAVAAGLALASQAQAAAIDTVGSASVNGNSIELTNYYGQTGAAWFATPLSTSQNFTETFSFSLVGPTVQADGISFALQNAGTGVVGGGGGDIGYQGLDAVGSIVQTYYNNRVGLNTTGDVNNTPSFNGSEIMAYNGTITGTETVAYNAATHSLSLTGTIDGYSFSQAVSIDLAQRFGATMFAGFTGGTGGATSTQTITSFTTPVPEAGTMSMMAAGLALVGVMSRRRRQSRAA